MRRRTAYNDYRETLNVEDLQSTQQVSHHHRNAHCPACAEGSQPERLVDFATQDQIDALLRLDEITTVVERVAGPRRASEYQLRAASLEAEEARGREASVAELIEDVDWERSMLRDWIDQHRHPIDQSASPWLTRPGRGVSTIWCHDTEQRVIILLERARDRLDQNPSVHAWMNCGHTRIFDRHCAFSKTPSISQLHDQRQFFQSSVFLTPRIFPPLRAQLIPTPRR